jgi:SAM-dependent methyltransferase
MTDFEDVVTAWQQPEAVGRIHPLRQVSEDAYWASGEAQAREVFSLVGEGARVIDFGAGDGRLSIPMHRAGLQVLAVDSSPEMLHRITDREPEIATITSDGDNLAFALAGDKADAVVCRAVLIHHSHKDVTRLVAQFAQVVKPGGLLIADWPVSEAPSERSDWIGVTTWDRSIRDEVALRLGWEPVSVDSDPSVWRRTDTKKVVEAVQESGGVRTEEIDNALPPNKVIREWAAANGYTVSARGKIPTDIITAYLQRDADDVL